MALSAHNVTCAYFNIMNYILLSACSSKSRRKLNCEAALCSATMYIARPHFNIVTCVHHVNINKLIESSLWCCASVRCVRRASKYSHQRRESLAAESQYYFRCLMNFLIRMMNLCGARCDSHLYLAAFKYKTNYVPDQSDKGSLSRTTDVQLALL